MMTQATVEPCDRRRHPLPDASTLKSRQDALAAHEKFYVGPACAKCRSTVRYVANSACAPCTRAELARRAAAKAQAKRDAGVKRLSELGLR